MRVVVHALLCVSAVVGCSGTDEIIHVSKDGGSSAASSSGSDETTGGSSSSSGGTSSSSSSSSSSGGTSTDAGTDAASSEFDVPAKCTNGNYTGGNGSKMKPGQACLSCHGNDFSLAGTVYPSAHEPDDCKGISTTGTTIVVTNKNNQSTSMAVNSGGNFYSQSSFTFPLQVKVVSGGKERVMNTPLTAAMGGDCNHCHTQTGDGTPKAPGRILMPN